MAVKQEKAGANNTHTLRMLSVKDSWCAAQCNKLAVAINLSDIMFCAEVRMTKGCVERGLTHRGLGCNKVRSQ